MMSNASISHSVDDFLRAYPYLEKDDIQAALAYAARRSEEIEAPAFC